jgi:hypothetical protein
MQAPGTPGAGITGAKAVSSLASVDLCLLPAGPDGKADSSLFEDGVISPAIVGLYRLARSLRGPVRRGWLSVAIADSTLLLAARRVDLGGMDVLDVATRLQRTVWREVGR